MSPSNFGIKAIKSNLHCTFHYDSSCTYVQTRHTYIHKCAFKERLKNFIEKRTDWIKLFIIRLLLLLRSTNTTYALKEQQMPGRRLRSGGDGARVGTTQARGNLRANSCLNKFSPAEFQVIACTENNAYLLVGRAPYLPTNLSS